MKHIVYLICLFTSLSSLGQSPFVTQWEVQSDDLQIAINTNDSFTYDFTIDLGDGTILSDQTGDVSHTYSNPGTYTVSITGQFPAFLVEYAHDDKLLSVEQWGSIEWKSMADAFKGNYNLDVVASDMPDLSNVSDMSYMFNSINSIQEDINGWDVSNVNDMSHLFNGVDSFNKPLGNWDVSNVVNMQGMFGNCENFNQNINSWDVSNVSDLSVMFSGCDAFDQPLDNWDVSSATDLSLMFISCDSFNKPLNNWDVSNVTDISRLFKGCASFNQALDNWDVSNVQSASSVFANAVSFNSPINGWDLSNSGVYGMFSGAVSFDQSLDQWSFSSYGNLTNFISNTSLNETNYDNLLDRLVQLQIEGGVLDATGVSYCDPYTRQDLLESGWTINDDGLSDDCSINFISGSVIYDSNNDGCDINDPVVENYLVNVESDNDSIVTSTDDTGKYEIAVFETDNVLDVIDLSNDLQVTPNSQNVDFNGFGNDQSYVDFCITPLQSFFDLSVNLFPVDDARPGFESEYEIVVENNGTQVQNNVQLTFTFEDTYQSFVSASQTASQNGDSLVFSIDDLNPFASKVIYVTLLNVQPPGLNSGDVVGLGAIVEPQANDMNVDDNSSFFKQTIVNSFDPNDKLVTQGDQIPDEKIDEYLDYKIRFQNKGTANAINVAIRDTISDKLDWSTFQPINSSHQYRLEIIDQEEINFIFDNINLPYESLDEEGSNGHVSFKIKPKSNVQIGDVIENTAYIYFDFNPPIVTNTVSTTVVDELSTEGFVKQESIRLFPNPADDQVELINNSDAEILQLKLYSIDGKQISSFNDRSILDVSRLSAGVYILQLETRYNKINKRLIKR